MKARDSAPVWVQNLRGTLRESVGKSYTVTQQGNNCKVIVRFQNKITKYLTLPYEWNKANSRIIQEQVEELARLISNGNSFEDAKNNLLTLSGPKTDEPQPDKLVGAWEKFGKYKIATGEIKKTTWLSDYGAAEERLKEVSTASNAHDLLTKVAARWEPGIRIRAQAVRQVASFLRWSISKDSKYLLEKTQWEPPGVGQLQQYTGKKSAAKLSKEEPTIPFEESEILEILESLPIESKHPRDRNQAKKWQLVIQCLACFGLRPIEVLHLEIRKNGSENIWCNYIKRSGGGDGKPRRLIPLHEEWFIEWNLLERIRESNRNSFPESKNGMGEALRNYLRRNEVFKRIKSQKDVVGYSFRHSYSRRAHQEYGMSDTVVAAMMGHSTQVHNEKYAAWSSESMLEDALERGKNFRRITQSAKS
tara:strand:- start:5849 stop:7105 length:1257 start_codon:yes stop_codon:yes gene_type:complete